MARPLSMGSHTVGEYCTILSFRNYTSASKCVQVFSKRYAYQFLHRYTKNRLSETFPLGNHRRAAGPPDRTSDDRRRSRRRTPLHPPGTFQNTARLCLPQPVKDAAAEQVLFQFLRVEIAKSGNSAHKYAPQQKMQGALRCGEHPCFSLSVYSPAAGLILRLCRRDVCRAALKRSTDGTALPQAGIGALTGCGSTSGPGLCV